MRHPSNYNILDIQYISQCVKYLSKYFLNFLPVQLQPLKNRNQNRNASNMQFLEFFIMSQAYEKSK